MYWLTTSSEVVVLPPVGIPTANSVEVCEGEDVIISATGSGSGDLVFYDDTQTEVGRVTMSAVNPTGTYNAGALVTGSYVYYVAEDDGSCVSNLQAGVSP